MMISTGLPLNSTFIHLPGIGRHREIELWRKGVLDWNRFLEAASNGTLSRETYRNAVNCVRESLWAVERRDLSFFASLLPECELWRLYPEFADDALFLDIETTGFAAENNNVTLIATFSNRNLSLFVAGVNLSDFPCHIAQYSLLVTFNGSQFDLPFLRTHFPEAQLDKAHIDLRYLLASLGYKGGLKAVERAIGLHREPLVRGITGQDAPKLWQQYLVGDDAALEILALYNLTDAVHLVQLLRFAIREKARRLEFPGQMVTADGQESFQSCTEYLAEWLTKHRGRESSLETLRRLAVGSNGRRTCQGRRIWKTLPLISADVPPVRKHQTPLAGCMHK
jgi:uncharacterized protein YprB with RNaseH-like and TPR domain